MLFSSTDAQPGGARAAPLFPFGMAADTPAEQFAGWLPYSAYLADEKIFVNRDGMGFMLEVMPQSGGDERMGVRSRQVFQQGAKIVEWQAGYAHGRGVLVFVMRL